jgi:hypothetical protein
MFAKSSIAFVVSGLCITLLAGCATSSSTPSATASPPPAPAAAPAAAPAPAAVNNGAGAAENDTAAALEKKFRDAARGYKVVQKDGQTLYCKREKLIGTTIPSMRCITEAQLRNEVETMDEVRNKMRSGAKCTLGPGCSGS